jgi:muramoyltetrapeptide carboxypeptidase
MSARLQRPNRLQPGDQVALLSPASPPPSQLVKTACQRLEKLGLRVALGHQALKQTGYLAGTDQQRTRDLQQAMINPKIRGIFFTRGGYGCARILEQLPLSLFKKHSKVIVGFSDLTLIHLAIQKTGGISFWGPMPAAGTGFTPYASTWLQKAVFQKAPLGILPIGKSAIQNGSAQGRLTGGTLALLISSLGTSYEIETKNRIVFIEDVDEAPYRIDRMLTHLLAAGKLKDAAGIVLGTFVACTPKLGIKSFSLAEVFRQRLVPLKIPIVSGFKFGHITNQLTLPYGVKAKLDAGKRSLEILESGVT